MATLSISMRRRVAVTLGALAVSLAWLAGASAQSVGGHERGYLVLEGNQTASALVRLTTTTHWIAEFQVHTVGQYAGFTIRRAGTPNGPVLEAGFRDKATDDGLPEPVAVVQRHTLTPGSYIVTLVADGRSRVEILVPGLTGRLVVQPIKHVAIQAKQASAQLAGSLPAGYARVPVKVSRHSFVAELATQQLDASEAQTFQVCVTKQFACPPTDAWIAPTPETCNLDCGNGFYVTNAYQPGELPAGDNAALFQAAGIGVSSQEELFVVVIG
jgi:hypothetical protein